eukprot:NODE_97_length_21155_cov_0.234850.p5 type:complete len:347 gc:universal NODE_97_length_21155_cov_0.234850:1973-3013(+)
MFSFFLLISSSFSGQIQFDASSYVCSLDGPLNNLVILPETDINAFGLQKVVSFGDLHIGVVKDENAHLFAQHSIFKDNEVHITNYDEQTNPVWPLAQISNSNSFKFPPQAGLGVDIYVIDTGVTTAHVEFEGRAKWGLNMFPYDPSDKANSDLNGHGTHVAGIAASKTYGVAKKSNIIAVKALSQTGNSRWSCILDALQWVYLTQKTSCNPVVINLSLSGAKNEAINKVLNDLVDKGLTIVTAAGNSAGDSCIYTPASADKTITVGSVSQNKIFSRFSNYGMCLDLLAPGESIASLGTGTTTKNIFKSGTSMASPHVVILFNLGRYGCCTAKSKQVFDTCTSDCFP